MKNKFFKILERTETKRKKELINYHTIASLTRSLKKEFLKPLKYARNTSVKRRNFQKFDYRRS